MKSKMFPYIFAVFQFILLIFGVMPFANSPIATAGRADHAFKVIMPFQLWILAFSIASFALFYRLSKKGVAEKSMVAISFAATVFSIFNLALHLIDNLLLWTWATGNITIILYSTVPTVGFYKISNVFLLHRVRRFRKSKKY